MSSQQYVQVPLEDAEDASEVTMDVVSPPSYEAFEKEAGLPSYEQVSDESNNESLMHVYLPSQNSGGASEEHECVNDIADANAMVLYGLPLGGTCHFLVAMILSYFFNWIGYIFCYFLVPSLAGKNGAASGLGLNLLYFGLFYLLPLSKNDSIDVRTSVGVSREHTFALSILVSVCGGLIFTFSVINWARIRLRVLSYQQHR